MGASVSIDGVLVDPDRAAVPVMDRGFLYGDSAFEVTRTYGGQPFALGLHLDRLERSCARLGIHLGATQDTLRGEIRAAIAAAANEESYLRVIVTRGITEIGLGVGQGETARRVLVVLPLPPQPPALYEDGVELATVTSARALDGSGAAGAKASNYLPNILSLAAARARGGYEALSVGVGGEVLEGATSNVFVVSADGAVWTPPLGLGILEGITRGVVMDAAREEGLEVVERLFFPSELYRAREAFITSSLREVVPVVRVDGARIGEGRPGPITRRLHAAFRRRLEAMLAAERG